jgi:hypothetical protein
MPKKLSRNSIFPALFLEKISPEPTKNSEQVRFSKNKFTTIPLPISSAKALPEFDMYRKNLTILTNLHLTPKRPSCQE